MSAVQVHRRGPLTILPQFFQENDAWGQRMIPNVDGGCLITQVVYSVSAQTGVSEEELLRPVIDYAEKRYVHCTGVDLGLVVRLVKRALPNKTKIGAIRHESVDDVTDALESGGTTIAIYNAHNGLDPGSICSKSYICSPCDIKDAAPVLTPDGKSTMSPYLHTLLVVGYDAGERTLIMRDNRPLWSRRTFGLGKYPVDPIRENKGAFAFIELVVN